MSYYNFEIFKNWNIKDKENSKYVEAKLKDWNYFLDICDTAISFVFEQESISESIIIAEKWYYSCVRLGKKFYGMIDVNDKIYADLNLIKQCILENDFNRLKDIYVNTFTNVALYGFEKDDIDEFN